MAAALSASPWGPSRARAGREPGKIQPLSAARVAHGAETSGGGARRSLLGRPGAPSRARLRRRVRAPGCPQIPRRTPLPCTPAHPVFCHFLLLWRLSHPHTPFSPRWLPLPKLERGPSSRVLSLHRQAQGQAPTTAPPCRNSTHRDPPDADPCTPKAHTGVNADSCTLIHSWRSRVCVDTRLRTPSGVGHLQTHHTQQSNTPMAESKGRHAPRWQRTPPPVCTPEQPGQVQ